MSDLAASLPAVILALASTGLATRLLPRLSEEDGLESIGRSGLLGLGFLGLATLMSSYYLPVPLRIAIPSLGALAIVGGLLSFRTLPAVKTDPTVRRFLPAILAPFALTSFLGVLTPADMVEWDSLAYHLAVPKLWLARDTIDYVQNIHHSNFPFVWDMLYLHGLFWAGETGAKAFNMVAYLFGALWVFGVSKRWFSSQAALWSMAAYLSIPVALWQSGTAYIDLAHGLFAAIGVCSLIDAFEESHSGGFSDPRAVCAGVGLGMALGSKHTGLQALLASVLALMAIAVLAGRGREGLRRFLGLSAICSLIALTLASPWYLKSIRETGNPTYPFFSSVFPSREWDAWRARIYAEEQRSFGVGHRLPAFGHAVLGLAYQPGRYANPGQTLGLGYPFAGIGFAGLLLGFVTAAQTPRNARTRRRYLLLYALAILVLWFLLSQQSRYLTILAIPLSVLAGGLTERSRAGPLAKATIVAQSILTLLSLWSLVTFEQLRFVVGPESREEYRDRRVPFSIPAREIDRLPPGSKVALYDEVFGFLLDRDYVWANPGHSSWIRYERMEGGEDLGRELAGKGFTHVYINLDPRLVAPADGERWLRAAGLLADSESYTGVERSEMRRDPNLWWRWLAANAVRLGRLRPIRAFGQSDGRPRALLFEVAR